MPFFPLQGSICESSSARADLFASSAVPEARIKWNKPGSSCSSSNLPTSFLSSLVVTSLLSSHPDPAGILLGDASPGLLLGDALSGSVQVCTLVVFVNLADLFYTTTTLRNVFGIPTSVATFTEFNQFSTSLDCPTTTFLTPTDTSTQTTTPTSPTTTTVSPTISPTTTSSNAIVTTAAVAAAVAVAVGVGVGVGVAQAVAQAAAQGTGQTLNQQGVQNIINQVVNGQGTANNNGNPVPNNALPFFVLGASVPDDSCGDGGARGPDGSCVPVLKSGNCPPMQWLTLDPDDFTAKCSPRLCGNGRIFLASDGLCHDYDDARQECPGGRRLYYTAYADPICDCPVGHYPYPATNDSCVELFTRGPCSAGQIVRPDDTGNLTCTKSECIVGKNKKPMAMAEDGKCYQLGTNGPCNATQLFSFDIFTNNVICANVLEETSPYFLSVEEQNKLEKEFSQKYPYNEIYVWYPKFKQWLQRRQSEGIFQLPTFSPDPALAPCRPGARNGNNVKCTNPLSPRGDDRGDLRQAVRPSITCRPGQSLSARGDCRDSSDGASCGPSYEWNAALRRCTQGRFRK